MVRDLLRLELAGNLRVAFVDRVLTIATSALTIEITLKLPDLVGIVGVCDLLFEALFVVALNGLGGHGGSGVVSEGAVELELDHVLLDDDGGNPDDIAFTNGGTELLDARGVLLPVQWARAC